MIPDLDDLFSEMPDAQSEQSYNNTCNNELYLQSPISMPSDLLNFPNASNSKGSYDLVLQLGSDPRPIQAPIIPNKRVADFSSPEYDFSMALDSQSYCFACNKMPQSQYNPLFMEAKQYPQSVPIQQLPQPNFQKTEPKINLTFDDVCLNFQYMQQQNSNKNARNREKRATMAKKKLIKHNKKQVFKPFASLESCELSVDKMRSFFEAHRRNSNRRRFI